MLPFIKWSFTCERDTYKYKTCVIAAYIQYLLKWASINSLVVPKSLLEVVYPEESSFDKTATWRMKVIYLLYK